MDNSLQRFKTAQLTHYQQAEDELKNGKKQSHWMWFIFPQITGLGKSAISKKYEIKDIKEANEYLSDPILAGRLLDLIDILLDDVKERSAEEIFGFPDYLKFQSCLTLFSAAVENNSMFKNNPDFACFSKALAKYYNGKKDQATVDILATLPR